MRAVQVSHLADLHGHEGPVWQVAWAHPKFGSLLASCSFDNRVIVWKEVQDNVWQQVCANGCREVLRARGACAGGRRWLLRRAPAARRLLWGVPWPARPPLAPPRPGSPPTRILAPAAPQVYQSPLHTASVNSLCWAPYELGLVLAAASSDGSLSVLTYQPDVSWHADKVRLQAGPLRRRLVSGAQLRRPQEAR